MHKVLVNHVEGLSLTYYFGGGGGGRGCSVTKKRDITPPMFYGIQSKVNQVIFTLILNIILNVSILAQAVL